MPDQDWKKFERCALQLDALHDELQIAEANRNRGLAQTIEWRIRSAESLRDRLLCRVSHALPPAA